MDYYIVNFLFPISSELMNGLVLFSAWCFFLFSCDPVVFFLRVGRSARPAPRAAPRPAPGIY